MMMASPSSSSGFSVPAGRLPVGVAPRRSRVAYGIPCFPGIMSMSADVKGRTWLCNDLRRPLWAHHPVPPSRCDVPAVAASLRPPPAALSHAWSSRMAGSSPGSGSHRSAAQSRIPVAPTAASCPAASTMWGARRSVAPRAVGGRARAGSACRAASACGAHHRDHPVSRLTRWSSRRSQRASGGRARVIVCRSCGLAARPGRMDESGAGRGHCGT